MGTIILAMILLAAFYPWARNADRADRPNQTTTQLGSEQ